MKKAYRLIMVTAIGTIAALMLCACNEYKQAQDEFTGEVNGLISEAQDLKSQIDEHVSEFNEAASQISDAVSDLKSAVGEVSETLNRLNSSSSKETPDSETESINE